MKKAFIASIVFFLYVPIASATSGACSYHGGVDCSVSSYYATCGDGTQSSVLYSDMQECNEADTPVCRVPSDEEVYKQLCQKSHQDDLQECAQANQFAVQIGMNPATSCPMSSATELMCGEAFICHKTIQAFADMNSKVDVPTSTPIAEPMPVVMPMPVPKKEPVEVKPITPVTPIVHPVFEISATTSQAIPTTSVRKSIWDRVWAFLSSVFN